jgi:hypothetical protein
MWIHIYVLDNIFVIRWMHCIVSVSALTNNRVVKITCFQFLGDLTNN